MLRGVPKLGSLEYAKKNCSGNLDMIFIILNSNDTVRQNFHANIGAGEQALE